MMQKTLDDANNAAQAAVIAYGEEIARLKAEVAAHESRQSALAAVLLPGAAAKSAPVEVAAAAPVAAAPAQVTDVPAVAKVEVASPAVGPVSSHDPVTSHLMDVAAAMNPGMTGIPLPYARRATGP